LRQFATPSRCCCKRCTSTEGCTSEKTGAAPEEEPRKSSAEEVGFIIWILQNSQKIQWLVCECDFVSVYRKYTKRSERACHPEQSEGSDNKFCQILHFVQDDKLFKSAFLHFANTLSVDKVSNSGWSCWRIALTALLLARWQFRQRCWRRAAARACWSIAVRPKRRHQRGRA